MYYLTAAVIVCVLGYVGWKTTSRSAYESAEYMVLESDGSFEVREYPDLMLAKTAAKFQSQGNDGSFGRLFRYISGGNQSNSKVAMTTPVFMEPETRNSNGRMGFVIPKKTVAQSIPNPTSESVRIHKRKGGRFAVYRFAGRLNSDSQTSAEEKLRNWIESNAMNGGVLAEFAGYDPPWTPGPLRRNEILIRLN